MGSFHGHERALLLAASGQNGLAIDRHRGAKFGGALSQTTFERGTQRERAAVAHIRRNLHGGEARLGEQFTRKRHPPVGQIGNGRLGLSAAATSGSDRPASQPRALSG